jgi:hypothetical protein
VKLAHLTKRFWGSVSTAPPAAPDEAWATTYLSPAEAELWSRMAAQDQRHSIQVARRFAELRPDATRQEMAGALLHDAGKRRAGLGTFGRVVATIVGPRTTRFREYHDHERIGAEWAALANADPATIELIRGEGPAAADLRAADEI